jgi:predicted nucleotidyltransferase
MFGPIVCQRGPLEAICRRFRVDKLHLFGSAAMADALQREPNDLDFLVEFADPLGADYVDNYFGLKDELERLFGLPVDLIAVPAIRNPYFREAVEKTKRTLYAA